MPQVILDRAQVMPLVCQSVSTGMAKHVGVYLAKSSSLTDASCQVVDPLTGKLLASFDNKQPGQSGIPDSQVASNRTQLIAFELVMRRETALQSINPDPCGFQVQSGYGQTAQLGSRSPCLYINSIIR